MTNSTVAVVDYGIGNVFSVCNAFKLIGADVVLTSDRDALLAADRLVLPGVGAFQLGMQELQMRGHVDTVKAFAETGRPMMGICLGMQMLMTNSHENGEFKGLDLISGSVEAIPGTGPDGSAHKVPHIAWAGLDVKAGSHAANTLLSSVSPNDSFYFVHSYHALPSAAENIVATADYNGLSLTAAIGRDNIIGLQFHPERSGPCGLNVLKTFLTL